MPPVPSKTGWATTPRLCLLATLTVFWSNYLLTERWAHVPGSLHGPKEIWFVAVLAASTLLALVCPVGRRVFVPLWVARLTAAAAVTFLGWAFLVWFPPSTWSQIPFLDNWPARYQAAIDQIALFRRGAVVGWQWAFLGGYHLSSDLTVSLAVLAWLPVAIAGPQVGFHLLHALLFAAIPALVWLDLRNEPRTELKWFGAALAAIVAANYSYFLLRSGDTNSLAGVVTTAAALVAAGRVARVWWAGPAFVLSATLITYSHAGFLLFACCYLAVDVVVTREWRRGCLLAAGFAAAIVAGAPLTWESWRYPGFVFLNNAVLDPVPFNPWAYLRKVYYNVELLWSPGRRFNDYTGLAAALIPALVYAAIRAIGRVRLHACWALATLALVRFYDPGFFGWGLLRAIHMYVVFCSAVLAWVLLEWSGRRALLFSLLATTCLYIQVSLAPVPHVASIEDFDPALVARLRALDGAAVLLENSYHAEMDTDPGRRSPPTPFPAHFEALLPAATGQRFYAGVWDGWQWSPARRNLLANGSLGGRRLEDVSDEELYAELRRWGVRHLVVWSDIAVRRLSGASDLTLRWRHGRWHHFEMANADVRDVVCPRGEGRIVSRDPLSARVALRDVSAGDLIVVRTNYYPAWEVRHRGTRVPVLEHEGQLAFRAPASGSYEVALEYPRYRWALWLALAALVTGSVGLALTGRGSQAGWRMRLRRDRETARSEPASPAG